MDTDAYPWHDLYVGRGADAVYVGSIRSPYEPADLIAQHDVLKTPLPEDAEMRWARTVRRMKNAHESVNDWPHEYRTSAETPWSWHWDGAGLYVYRQGTPYLVATPVAKRVSGTAFPVVTR